MDKLKSNIKIRFVGSIILVILLTLTCSLPQGDSDWHEVGSDGEPAFQNDWTNTAGFPTCAFRKDNEGFVYLKGRVDSGTAEVIFTLPSDYRPEEGPHVFLTIGGNDPTLVTVAVDGTVYVNGNWVSLDGIIFYAGQ